MWRVPHPWPFFRDESPKKGNALPKMQNPPTTAAGRSPKRAASRCFIVRPRFVPKGFLSTQRPLIQHVPSGHCAGLLRFLWQIFLSPGLHILQHLDKALPQRGQVVLHLGRHLAEVLAEEKAVGL